jgi:peptidoglycan/xylan/chitin deacetylase (PgdA/CDA1 family)
MTRKVKALAGMLVYWTRLYRLFFRNRAVIVLFHRVDDELAERRDPITCSRATFQKYCDFFKRFFKVVPLSELVAKVKAGEDVSRHAVITFDDGYEDNHDFAAADLQARNLPACFFVVSEFIDSDCQAPWDAHAGVTSRWMGWDEVKALTRQGFEIGAHTRTHPDLGKTHGEAATDEIVGSKERLEKELETEITLFSYPFGGKDQITEENREKIKQAGFDCCLSAYGGTVPKEADPFHLERIAASNWFVSPYHFGLDAMLQGPIEPRPNGGADGAGEGVKQEEAERAASTG